MNLKFVLYLVLLYLWTWSIDWCFERKEIVPFPSSGKNDLKYILNYDLLQGAVLSW